MSIEEGKDLLNKYNIPYQEENGIPNINFDILTPIQKKSVKNLLDTELSNYRRKGYLTYPGIHTIEIYNDYSTVGNTISAY